MSETPDRLPIRRALLSTYDKSGLVELGKALATAGVGLVSTGSTAKTLAAAGLAVAPVEIVTGFAECLDGRVKTLHPHVHAGILADRRLESHRHQLSEMGVAPFDLVVVNLYPFAETVASGASIDECVEQIDIGGPAMVRAAAKNHPSVAVVTSPDSYPSVLAALDAGGFSLAKRQALAARAFQHTASYDVAVATWMDDTLVADAAATNPVEDQSGFSEWVGSTWTKAADLRYGENSHQSAALYRGQGAAGLAGAEQLHGKEMSYNNYVDTDAAWRAVWDFAEPAVAVIKHANPCGIAVGEDIESAHRRAHACDPVSAFGGVIAANREISVAMAEQVAEIFTEVVVAPGFAEGALEVLQRKKNVRVLRCEPDADPSATEFRRISGGLLGQETDRFQAEGDDPANWTRTTGAAGNADQLADLSFAWRACRAVKSNAILLAKGGASVGVGMGQVNRVDAARLAVERAGDRSAGSVAASDAFFPFADGPQILIEAGVTAIVSPGGSVRDSETIAACEAAGVTMYFTGTRHFFH